MGTLLVESANDKKYRYLKKLLINSMTQGHNRYPNSKASKYTMLCKYVPDLTNNKNNSTTTRNSPVSGVSLYQRATLVDGPQVSVTNCITEDIFTCWKCGLCGHRSLLCPKSDNKCFQGMQFVFTQVTLPHFTDTAFLNRDALYLGLDYCIWN